LPEVVHIKPDWLVTQQGITLAQAEEDEDETAERLDLPKPISGVRGQLPRMPMNDFELIDMRGVMNGFSEGETSRIMQGKINDKRFPEAQGWRKMQQVFREINPPVTIHYFENVNTGERAQFHFVSKPAFYDPRFW